MKANLLLRATVSVAALAVAQAAHAQEFYAGLGFESGSGDMSFPGFSFDTDHTAVSAIVGYSYPLANSFFVGGELETSLSTDYSFFGSSSGVSLDRLSRLRFLAGYDFGQFAVFGALGGTLARGDFIGSSTNNEMSGLNFGIGGEFAATDRVSLRLEAIRDQLSGDISGTNYDWDNTSIRAAAIIKF